MYLRILLISSILVPQLGWSQISIQNMSSQEFLSFTICSPLEKVLDQMVFEDALDRRHFIRHRQNMRDFLANSYTEIRKAFSEGDLFQAAEICAWADDITLGFQTACPKSDVPEEDLLSPNTKRVCEIMAQKE